VPRRVTTLGRIGTDSFPAGRGPPDRGHPADPTGRGAGRPGHSCPLSAVRLPEAHGTGGRRGTHRQAGARTDSCRPAPRTPGASVAVPRAARPPGPRANCVPSSAAPSCPKRTPRRSCGSPAGRVPACSVAKTTRWPASVSSRQGTATSVTSKSRSGTGISTRTGQRRTRLLPFGIHFGIRGQLSTRPETR